MIGLYWGILGFSNMMAEYDAGVSNAVVEYGAGLLGFSNVDFCDIITRSIFAFGPVAQLACPRRLSPSKSKTARAFGAVGTFRINGERVHIWAGSSAG